MKRIVTLSAVMFFGGLGLATAQAGHPSGSNHSSQHSSNKQNNGTNSTSSKLKVYMGGSSSGPKGTPENPFCKDHCDHCDHDHCDHKDCHDPKYPVIDPGKGDGKSGNTTVITDPIYPWANVNVRDHRTGSTGGTTTGGNFVWAGDHWERAKATTAIVDPIHDGASGGVTVTSTTGTNVTGFHGGGGASTIRDHRNGGSPGGGVTVTNTQGSTRNNDVVGVGGSPIDTAIQGVVDFFSFDVGSVPPSGGTRDHRTTDTSNFGSNVRDHRN